MKMKISTTVILSAAISSVMVSTVTGGACISRSVAPRDECLCECLRSGYDCATGEDLNVDATDQELKARCTSTDFPAGPCAWDPRGTRTNTTCGSGGCDNTIGTCDGGGGVDPPSTDCTAVDCSGATSRKDCDKTCCSYGKTAGCVNKVRRLGHH